MLELYQFELSQYSEKVRLVLDYKELDYRKIEVTPGVGQFELLRMSGQTKVPVLKDGDTIVADSTEIAFYLDRKYPERPIVPTDPHGRGLCLLMEEWADTSIGLGGRWAFVGALGRNQNLRTALLPQETPDFLRSLVGAVPSAWLETLGQGLGAVTGTTLREAEMGLRQDLEALCLLLQDNTYLLGGETPTLADLTVAGLSVLLKFPERGYLDLPEALAGCGLPGLGDNEAYRAFFEWRDRLYSEFRKPSQGSGNGNGDRTPPTDAPPTSIAIE